MPSWQLLCFALTAFAGFEPSPALAQDGAAKEIQREVREFQRMVGRVLREEPELIYNPKLRSVQSWTHKYERYAGSAEAGDFRRVFVVPSATVTLPQLTSAYLKYAKEATKLSQELPSQVKEHVAMFTDDKYREDYRRKYNAVIASLFPDETGQLKEFKVESCDYITQPTDAFWFLFHATRFLDRYGSALFRDEWPKVRAELQQKHGLKPLDDLQKAVEPKWSASRPGRAEDPCQAGKCGNPLQ